MITLTRMLCRLARCVAPARSGARDGAPAGTPHGAANGATRATPGESSSDDLTAIRGIGIATQDRLYRAGIKSFSELAAASPDRVREILGSLARGARVESWIEDAAGLADPK